MRSLDWYLDTAVQRAKFTSDRQLALAMGLDQSVVHQMRKRGMLPADATMLKLADYAGISADVALLDLNQWRAKDPASRAIYERIAAMLAKTAAAILLLVSLASPHANAAATGGHASPRGLYIMENIEYWFSGKNCKLSGQAQIM